MTFLAKQRKADLITLADEIEVELHEGDKIAQIIRKIEASPNYSEEFVRARLEVITEERKATEALAVEREKVEREEKRAEREYEIERARLAQETLSVNSARSEEARSQQSIKIIMQKYDPEKSDISLFLTLFERQAKRIKIEEGNWVSHLISLLPVEIAEIVMRESEEEADNFAHVKKVLLDRFKISPEAFRTKFVQHQKRPGAPWKDLVFELKSYLQGWLDGVQIFDFESLKKLMVADQIKRRVPAEIKEHFLTDWGKIVDPDELVGKLDEYEAARKTIRKPNFSHIPDKIKRVDKTSETKKAEGNQKDHLSWRNSANKEGEMRKQLFERRKAPACFECGSTDHFRPSCPKLKKNQYERVNNIAEDENLGPSFSPYLSKAKINGRAITLLRDTGASIDVTPSYLVTQEDMTGEIVWVKQPLDDHFKCLPLARVFLESKEYGQVETKAAVVDNSIEMEHYLLGNRTFELLREGKKNPERINAVITRRQAKAQESEREKSVQKPNIMPEIEEEPQETLLELPPLEENEIRELIRESPETFKGNQRDCDSLTHIWERVESGKNSEFKIEKGLLLRRSTDHRGTERKQLVIPRKYREQILRLCHEGIAAHLGATKTKDKMLRYYFWPNCIKGAEEFVRTCDPCQRVGKSREKKKAPLKLVPIIKEVFSKLSVDTVGPLPISTKENKYLVTAMCVASKYPEAIPIADVGSESVTNALLMIFSRLGFPREFQCDLGKSFTSNLITTFFETFGKKLSYSSVRQSNVERWLKSVKRLLKVLCLESGRDWVQVLPVALLALRSVMHESTGFSPAELVLGRNLRTPETLPFEHWVEPEEENLLVTEYVFSLINRLKNCQDLAAERMGEMQIKRKNWYDRNAVTRNFAPGEKVLVIAACSPSKLAVQWVGPEIIGSKLSEKNYIVRMPGRTENFQIFHVNLLKPYHQRVEHVNLLVEDFGNYEANETDIEIPYATSNQNIYDFDEIAIDSKLHERYTTERTEEFEKLLWSHKNHISNNPDRTDFLTRDLDLNSNQPVRCKLNRTSPRQTKLLKTKIKRMLYLKIIEINQSVYTSPMILNEAPGRDPHPCIDYRKLNSIIRTEYFPLPNIEEKVEKVSVAKIITLIDLTKDYRQMQLTPRAQRLAAFVNSFGIYKLFGLINAPLIFSKFMAQILQSDKDFSVLYQDDVATFLGTRNDHIKRRDWVRIRKDKEESIKEAKRTIKPSKCRFAQTNINYLGHMAKGRRSKQIVSAG